MDLNQWLKCMVIHGWEDFWTRTAFLSVVLAFMNLLPIPALDGGHVVFTL